MKHGAKTHHCIGQGGSSNSREGDDDNIHQDSFSGKGGIGPKNLDCDIGRTAAA